MGWVGLGWEGGTELPEGWAEGMEGAVGWVGKWLSGSSRRVGGDGAGCGCGTGSVLFAWFVIGLGEGVAEGSKLGGRSG